MHFAAALELFLKARLMKEHWSVIVAKDADFGKFTSGDFISVSIKDAIDRLGRIACCVLTKREQNVFIKVLKHRNRILHFYHDDLTEQDTVRLRSNIASEHLTAWYYLYKLVSEKWNPIFDAYASKLRNLDAKMRKYKVFLEAIYETIRQEIESDKTKGAIFITCYSCGYPAAEANQSYADDMIGEASCRVCESIIFTLVFDCPLCSSKIYAENGHGVCPSCNKFGYTPESIAIEWSGGFGMPAICKNCDGAKTVVEYGRHKYICLNCFEEYYSISECRSCGKIYAGVDLEESYEYGCPDPDCDGHRYDDE